MSFGAAKLDYDALFNNPNSRVLVSFSRDLTGLNSAGSSNVQGNVIVGYMMDNISIGGGNEYSDGLTSQMQDNMNETLQTVQGVAGMLGQQGSVRPISLKSFAQTVKQWTGAKSPSFEVSMFFLAARPTDDVTQPVRALLEAVYPIDTGDGMMKAPLQYGAVPQLNRAGTQITGTAMLQIGNWFRAPNQLIDSVEFEFSKEIISSGLPLRAEGKVSFSPYRALSYPDFMSYFVSDRQQQ